MILLSAFKCIGIAVVGLSLIGCVIATGTLFAAYITAVVRNPYADSRLFNALMLGFAFVETYIFFVFLFLIILLLY